MTHDPTRDCEHGRLKGKCDVCDLQAEVERLARANAELVEALNLIAGNKQCVNSLMSNADIARIALAKATGETK